jgi:hypothetical protein
MRSSGRTASPYDLSMRSGPFAVRRKRKKKAQSLVPRHFNPYDLVNVSRAQEALAQEKNFG